MRAPCRRPRRESIIAELQSWARPGGTSARARSSISARRRRAFVLDAERMRPTIRRTFVSTARRRRRSRRRGSPPPYRPDARQGSQLGGVARQGAGVTIATARASVQPDGARVVTEAPPFPHHVRRGRARQRFEAGKTRDEGFELRHDPVDLRLREHELAHDRAIRGAQRAPGQRRAAVARVPAQEPLCSGVTTEACAIACADATDSLGDLASRDGGSARRKL